MNQKIHSAFKLQRTVLGLLFLTLLGLSSCGSARRTEPIRGPLTLATNDLKRGQVVFMQNCQKCHPAGEAGVGPSINNVPLTKGLIKFRVRSKAFLLGLGRMPSFKKHEISKAELNDLVRYLKVLKKHDGDAVTAAK